MDYCHRPASHRLRDHHPHPAHCLRVHAYSDEDNDDDNCGRSSCPSSTLPKKKVQRRTLELEEGADRCRQDDAPPRMMGHRQRNGQCEDIRSLLGGGWGWDKDDDAARSSLSAVGGVGKKRREEGADRYCQDDAPPWKMGHGQCDGRCKDIQSLCGGGWGWDKDDDAVRSSLSVVGSVREKRREEGADCCRQDAPSRKMGHGQRDGYCKVEAKFEAEVVARLEAEVVGWFESKQLRLAVSEAEASSNQHQKGITKRPNGKWVSIKFYFKCTKKSFLPN